MRCGAKALATRTTVSPTSSHEVRDASSGQLLELYEVRCRPRLCLVQRSWKQQAYESAESMDAARRRMRRGGGWAGDAF